MLTSQILLIYNKISFWYAIVVAQSIQGPKKHYIDTVTYTKCDRRFSSRLTNFDENAPP
jgi:hypothetical protein